VIHPERWGHLKARYQDDTQPKKMLAIDGGGIRGLLTLGMLQRMEELLAAASGRGADFRLCEYFDYIAGTSTGAIIAAGLARGMSTRTLIKFYQDFGNQIFEKSHILKRLTSLYQADPLREQLRKVFNADEQGNYDSNGQDSNLFPEHLRCLLLVVTRNITTDSPWPISSNPDARYNEPGRADCNLKIPLWQLVRASTAAPVYFPPEVLNWDPGDAAKSFTFVDGGVTPYNNPAFLLFRMATHPAYRLGWKTGERNLLIISMGTGSAASPNFKQNQIIPANLLGLPGALMSGIQIDQDISCRTVGRCTYGEPIDRELRDLTCREASDDCALDDWFKASYLPLEQDLGRAFLYARYNADLSQEGLDRLGLSSMDPEKVQKLDAVDQMDNLLRIGKAAAAQISLEHFGSFAKPGAKGANAPAQTVKELASNLGTAPGTAPLSRDATQVKGASL
jgi:predicted acylesterase/phospholipase RssA